MTFSTASHDQHRIRRSVLNPFFSKRSIANNEAQIREKVEHLCRRLEVYSMTRDVLRLDGAYSALVSGQMEQLGRVERVTDLVSDYGHHCAICLRRILQPLG